MSGSDERDETSRRQRRVVPSSAFARGAKLAALPVGYAGRSALGLGKRLGGAPAEAVVTEVQRRTAEQVFSVLGQLKGGAMKFGQAMSIFEAALPEELAGPYRETLTKLQDAAPPMPLGVVTRQLTEQLGEDWETQLVELERTPAAAASIGQVHRGRWHDGRDVAVKVQYPGAAKALRSDLRQLSRVTRLFAVLAPGLDVKPLLKELTERIDEELDYRLEGRAQAAFAEAYDGDEHIAVPKVVHASEKLLVTEWMDSVSSLAKAVDLPAEERDRLGTLYAEFLLSGPRRAGLLHADPHPGNFRILADGRLGVVDYGAVAHLPDGLPPAMGPLLRAAIEGDADRVSEGLRQEGFLRPGTSISPQLVQDYLAPFVAPATQDAFTFDRDWLRAQVQRVSAPGAEGIGTAMKINLPPQYLLIHRVWMGTIGVLSQIGATVPVKAILEENLSGFVET